MSSAGEEQTSGMNRRNGLKDKMHLPYNPFTSRGENIMPVETISRSGNLPSFCLRVFPFLSYLMALSIVSERLVEDARFWMLDHPEAPQALRGKSAALLRPSPFQIFPFEFPSSDLAMTLKNYNRHEL